MPERGRRQAAARHLDVAVHGHGGVPGRRDGDEGAAADRDDARLGHERDEHGGERGVDGAAALGAHTRAGLGGEPVGGGDDDAARLRAPASGMTARGDPRRNGGPAAPGPARAGGGSAALALVPAVHRLLNGLAGVGVVHGVTSLLCVRAGGDRTCATGSIGARDGSSRRDGREQRGTGRWPVRGGEVGARGFPAAGTDRSDPAAAAEDEGAPHGHPG